MKKVIAYILTRLRITLVPIPFIKINFAIISTSEYWEGFLIGVKLFPVCFTINLILVKIEWWYQPQAFVRKRDNLYDAVQINLQKINELAWDTVIDEANAFDKRVSKKLNLGKDHIPGHSSFGYLDTVAKIIYIETTFIADVTKIKIPAQYVLKENQYQSLKEAEFKVLPLHQRICLDDYWRKE